MISQALILVAFVNGVASHMLRGRWDVKPVGSLQVIRRASVDAIFSVPTSLYHGTRHLGVRKSRILFHHVWKCGGANLCDMAIRNGEAVPQPEAPNPSSRCDVPAVTYQTPSEGTLLKANFTFASWQAPLTPGAFVGAKGQFALVTILRNPLDQALSHFHHVQHDFRLFANFSAFVDFGLCVASHNVSFDTLGGCELHLLQKSIRPPDVHPFAIFRDNQQLRWLEPTDVGMGVQGRPHLSSEDLKAAKARLDLFDEVIILEELHTRERWRFAKYGWHDLDDERGANLHLEVAFGRSNATAQLSPEMLSRLREVQRWDLELYHHGQEVARRQADVAHDTIEHAKLLQLQKPQKGRVAEPNVVIEYDTRSLPRDVRFWLADLQHTDNTCSEDKLEAAARAKAASAQLPWTDILRRFWHLNPPLPSFATPTWPIQWTFPGLVALDGHNGLFEVEQFLTTEEAGEIIRSLDQGAMKGSPVSKMCPTCVKGLCGARRSCNAWIRTSQSPLNKRIASLLNKVGDESHLEYLSITKYEPGGFFSDHFDDLNEGKTGNDRAATVIVYLNDVGLDKNATNRSKFAGGATYFSELQIRVRPQLGKAVVFFPTLPDGSKNWKMKHCAEDVQATKWVAQQWVRQKPIARAKVA